MNHLNKYLIKMFQNLIPNIRVIMKVININRDHSQYRWWIHKITLLEPCSSEKEEELK